MGNRYKCIGRYYTVDSNGKLDTRNMYSYKILDRNTNNIILIDGKALKDKLMSGVCIDEVKLTTDTKIRISKAVPTQAPPKRKPKIKDIDTDGLDLTLVMAVIGDSLYKSKIFSECFELEIKSLWLDRIRQIAKTAKMLGGAVWTINKQKVVAVKIGDKASLLTGKWKYSNNKPQESYVFVDDSWRQLNLGYSITWTFGYCAEVFGVYKLTIWDVEFTAYSLANAFSTQTGDSQLCDICISRSDLSHIRSMNSMCRGIPLRRLDIERIGNGLDSVKTMDWAFSNLQDHGACALIIDIPHLPNLISAEGLFANYKERKCPNLKFLDRSKLRSVRSMFSKSDIEYIYLGNIDLTQCEYAEYMFYQCKNLVAVELNGFMDSKLRDTKEMFSACTKLLMCDIHNVDLSNCTNSDSMFFKCSSLKYLDFGSKPITHLQTANSLFEGCSSLEYLDITAIQSKRLIMSSNEFRLYGCDVKTNRILDGTNIKTLKITPEMHSILKNNSRNKR